MKNIVQARLDRQTQQAMAQLMRRLGWTPSKVVREGLRLLAACHAGEGKQKIVGVGKYSSGIPDLASNKSHLKGFGT
jgi:hypothetical protein